MRFNQASCCLVIATIFLAACSKKKPAPPPPVPQVAVVAVQPQTVPLITDLPGRTNAYLVAQVRARVDGIVLKREFTEGNEVKAGQRLYKIDPAPYLAALNSAKASLAKAQANLVTQNALAERYKVLVSANAVSKQDYDNAVAAQGQAKADVAAGKAAVETARINLDYTDVISPIKGRVGISQVTPGAYVQAAQATLLSTVQQLDPMYVDLTQSSLDGLRLRQDIQSGRLTVNGPGAAQVTLILEDGSAYPLSGKLQFSDVTVDQSTGAVTVRAIFPNPQRVLLPGMFVRARLEEGAHNNAFLVPQIGLTHNAQGEATVMVVGADNKVTPRKVTALLMRGANWVVESGLQPNERVIVRGIDKVRPGMTVKAVLEQQAMPAADKGGVEPQSAVASAK